MANSPLYGASGRRGDYRDRLAAQLLAEGSSGAPIQSGWQGAARLAQALMGGYLANKGEEQRQGDERRYTEGLQAAFAPQFQPSPAGPGPRNDATMAPPSMQQSAQALIGSGDPRLAPMGAQMMMQEAAQRQAREEAARQPFNLRPGEVRSTPDGRVIASNPVTAKPENRFMNVAGVGLVDTSGDTPRVALPTQREQTPYQMVTTADGIFAIDPRNPSGPRVRLGDKPDRNEGEGRDFSQEKNIRTEYTNASKPFEDLRQHWTRLNAAHNQKDGPGDIAMVYSFMKMLDPTSVVREGEFATAQNAGGVPDQILQMYNRAIQGERLPDAVRDGFLQQGARQFDGLARNQIEIENRFKGLASQYGLNPDRVVPDVFGSVARPDPSRPFSWGGAPTPTRTADQGAPQQTAPTLPPQQAPAARPAPGASGPRGAAPRQPQNAPTAPDRAQVESILRQYGF
jgi:hypothetical protein